MASYRTSILADRHKALGSKLEDWNGMGTAWSYASDIYQEHITIRTKAGLMDVSGLKKVHVVGPDSTDVLNYICTRDLHKIYPGKSVYTAILNDQGLLTDDSIMFRLGPNSWMMVHGSGNAFAQLVKYSEGKKVQFLFDDDLHDISLQGPKSVDFLAEHVPGIRDLRYFHHIQTTLFGRPAMISRTGYTGERGYEIFASAKDIPFLWDTILEKGAPVGIIPCCFAVLDMLRVESYLLFYPYDNSPEGDSLWELGLEFTVSPGKTNFHGAEKHFALKGKERVKIFGILADTANPTATGDEIFTPDGQKVGYVTCGMVSKLTNQSIAIARLDPKYAVQGIKLHIRGKTTDCDAIAHVLPFDDPKKTKRTTA